MCQDQGRDTRRQASGWGEKVWESRTAVCSCREEEEEGAQLGPFKMASSGPLVCMVLLKLSETVSVRAAWGNDIHKGAPVLPAWKRKDLLVFAR